MLEPTGTSVSESLECKCYPGVGYAGLCNRLAGNIIYNPPVLFFA